MELSVWQLHPVQRDPGGVRVLANNCCSWPVLPVWGFVPRWDPLAGLGAPVWGWGSSLEPLECFPEDRMPGGAEIIPGIDLRCCCVQVVLLESTGLCRPSQVTGAGH